MLKRQVKEQYEDLLEQRNEMRKFSIEMYSTNKSLKETELKTIEDELKLIDELETIDEESEVTKERLLKEKESALNDIKEMDEHHVAQMAELDAIDKEFEDNLSSKGEDDNLETVLDSIVSLKKRADAIEDKECEEYKRLLYVTGLLQDSLQLIKVSNNKSTIPHNILKKKYKDLIKDAQTKLGKDSSYIFPSLYEVRKVLKAQLELKLVNDTDKKKADMLKIILCQLSLYITKTDLSDEGIYVYYILENIMSIEKLPIEIQLSLINNLLIRLCDYK